MSKETPNYKLIKPDETDFYDISVFNTNIDKIDEVLSLLAQTISDADVSDQLKDYAKTSYVAQQLASYYSKQETYSKEEIDDKAPVTSLATMSAANWDTEAKEYSFETAYPAEQYDVEIQPDRTCTDEQTKAWNAAQIVGSYNSNIAAAKGTVPTVDIPIILRVVKK